MKMEEKVVVTKTYQLELSEEEMVVIASLLGKVGKSNKLGKVAGKLFDEGFCKFYTHKDYQYELLDKQGIQISYFEFKD